RSGGTASQRPIGEYRELRAVGEVEAGEHLIDMRFRRSLRQVQRAGDRPVRKALAQVGGDLAFAGGEEPEALARCRIGPAGQGGPHRSRRGGGDRKSTRLNYSHVSISYGVVC